jgi:agmatinase
VNPSPPASSFLGAPVETDLARIDADAAIIGLPHGWAYPRPGTTAGCAEAPAAIRRRAERLARFRGNWDFDLGGPMLPDDRPPRFVDAGDVAGDPSDGAGNAKRITEAVGALLERGTVPICLGGDDSVPIPMLRAFTGRGPITVVQVDAHLDFRDEVDGVRDGYSSPMRRASEMDHVARIVQVGLRGVGSARAQDVEDARAAGNVLVTAADIRERGIGAALEVLPGEPRSIVVSFDCDGLDPPAFPAVSAQAPGGLSYAEAAALLGALGPRLAGAVVTEYVPALDTTGSSALVVVRLLVTLLAGLAA